MLDLFIQAIKYFLGASAGLAVDWITWTFIWNITNQPVLAQIIGKGIGSIVAYYLYRNQVFKESKVANERSQINKFILAVIMGWIFSVILYNSIVGHISPLQAKICTDGITFVLNWFVMKYWVFYSKPLISQIKDL